MFFVYVVAQILGAFVGFGMLVAITPPHIFQLDPASASGHCSTVPIDSLNIGQVFAIEFFATLVLIMLCCSSWDPRMGSRQDSVGLKFGFTVAGLSIAAVSLGIKFVKLTNTIINYSYTGTSHRMQHESGPNTCPSNLEQ